MIFPPQHPAPYRPVRILSIDPGTTNLGYTVIDLYERGQVAKIVVDCFTYNASKHLPAVQGFSSHYSQRYLRIQAHANFFTALLNQYEPTIVIAESPFMGRFAQSFEALVELRSALVAAATTYDPWLIVEFIEPTPVKSFLGAVIKGKTTKDSVREKLLERNDLTWPLYIDPTLLDEHSIDSAAIGLWRCQKYLNDGY